MVVRDVLVHQAPEPLDRVQMRTVDGDEVELDAAPRPRQPSLHTSVASVIFRVTHGVDILPNKTRLVDFRPKGYSAQ